ncbi:MAG: succinylglutamate desuccinylase/aspartoacylase family protein [Anaerolineae bacterium]|nr:succinylglutamate desuccinylase/aspartoacylase family protein [Anaerolineae bacterium]
MTACFEIGTARSRPGDIVYGVFEAVPLPTGGSDFFPVIIAQGQGADRPVLWLTGNIHGGEYDGLATIHHLLAPDLVETLSGTIIAIPTLSPAGLRTGQRSPYYLYGKDPNRLFPGLPAVNGSHEMQHPSAVEMAYARLFERIDATADYLIDLHNYGVKSIPFAFRDPIFYREPRDKPVARRLQQRVGDMLAALGLTVVNEYVSSEYLRKHLHRSVSGATLNTARIPAVTVELGGQQVVNVEYVQAAAAGIRNVMRWAGMLPGPAEPVQGVPVIDLGYPVRRMLYPRVPQACIVHHLVQPGDRVAAGDAVARLVDVYGRPVGADDGMLRSEYDGFVLGLHPGMALYPNDPVMGFAVRDDSDLVLPAPD